MREYFINNVNKLSNILEIILFQIKYSCRWAYVCGMRVLMLAADKIDTFQKWKWPLDWPLPFQLTRFSSVRFGSCMNSMHSLTPENHEMPTLQTLYRIQFMPFKHWNCIYLWHILYVYMIVCDCIGFGQNNPYIFPHTDVSLRQYYKYCRGWLRWI